MDNILREATESLGGVMYQHQLQHSQGLCQTYWDTVEGSATIQDVLHADDLALAAEQRQDLQRMLKVVDMVCKKM